MAFLSLSLLSHSDSNRRLESFVRSQIWRRVFSERGYFGGETDIHYFLVYEETLVYVRPSIDRPIVHFRTSCKDRR